MPDADPKQDCIGRTIAGHGHDRQPDLELAVPANLAGPASLPLLGSRGQNAAVTASDPEFLASWEQLGRFFMGTSDVHIALARVTSKLEELGIDHAICGGLAVNAHGHQRATTDVDILLTTSGLQTFKDHALGRGWLEKFPGSRGVRDTDRQVPIAVLLAGGIPGDGTPHGVVFPDPATVAIE